MVFRRRKSLHEHGYRGYYYDTETQLYFLKTRYYDPAVCRFINADDVSYLDPENVNGLNLYAYCLNNPVMYIDPNGTSILACILIGALIGLLVGAGTSIVSQGLTNGWSNISWGQVAVAGLAGAIGGAFGAGVGSVLTGFATGAAAGALTATSVSLGQAIAIGALSTAAAGIGSRMVYNAAYNSNASFGAQLGYVFNSKAMAIDMAVGGATAGIGYGINAAITGIQNYRIARAASHWDPGTFASGKASMMNHYGRHGMGNGPIQYTKDALRFAKQNGNAFSFIRGGEGLQPVWTLGRGYGAGANGLYTSDGKIVSFHYYYDPFH